MFKKIESFVNNLFSCKHKMKLENNIHHLNEKLFELNNDNKYLNKMLSKSNINGCKYFLGVYREDYRISKKSFEKAIKILIEENNREREEIIENIKNLKY